MNILLVEPNFPYPNKSKHSANEVHKNFLPIGLLKLGAYHKTEGDKVKLVRGTKSKDELNNFKPDKIFITTLFTFWSGYVWDTVSYYRSLFPRSEITIGGIYVTLHYKTNKFKRLKNEYKVKIHIGLHTKAEEFLPDYSLLSGKIDFHATHAMRGCIRRCSFCGTWRIEPRIIYKTAREIIKELMAVKKNQIIFYDNNFLANPNKKDILKALAGLKINNNLVLYESQSGFDGRILEKDPELAILIKNAAFRNVRIAWDNSIKDKKSIKKQIDFLVKAGYSAKELSVFMIYNFDIPLEEMIMKQKYCLKFGVQITDCRNRPLDIDFDNYKPHAWRHGQTSKDYYIHESKGWTDRKIRLFRSLIRTHNITIRYARDKMTNFDKLFKNYLKIKDPEKTLCFMKSEMGYKKDLEKWSSIHNTYKFFDLGRPPQMEEIKKKKSSQNRIKLMNKVKNICIKNQINPPVFKKTSLKEIDNKLLEFENYHIIKQS